MDIKDGQSLAAVKPLRIAVELLKPRGSADSDDAMFRLAEYRSLGGGGRGKTRKPHQRSAGLCGRDGQAQSEFVAGAQTERRSRASGRQKRALAERHGPAAKKILSDAITEYRASSEQPGEYQTSLSLARVLEADGELPEAEAMFTSLTDKEKQNLGGVRRSLPSCTWASASCLRRKGCSRRRSGITPKIRACAWNWRVST